MVVFQLKLKVLIRLKKSNSANKILYMWSPLAKSNIEKSLGGGEPNNDCLWVVKLIYIFSLTLFFINV